MLKSTRRVTIRQVSLAFPSTCGVTLDRLRGTRLLKLWPASLSPVHLDLSEETATKPTRSRRIAPNLGLDPLGVGHPNIIFKVSPVTLPEVSVTVPLTP